MNVTYQAARELLAAAAMGERIRLSGYEFSFGRAALWSPLRLLMDLDAIDWCEDDLAFVRTPGLSAHKTVAIMAHLKELEDAHEKGS